MNYLPGTFTGAVPIEAARELPSNIEAEQEVLGALLVHNDTYHRMALFLAPEHFFVEVHRRIYEVATPLIKAGDLASPVTLKTFLATKTSRACLCRARSTSASD
jgi:replicative DNA helicase